MHVELRVEARDDLADAAAFYDGQRDGLGDYFAASLDFLPLALGPLPNVATTDYPDRPELEALWHSSRPAPMQRAH